MYTDLPPLHLGSSSSELRGCLPGYSPQQAIVLVSPQIKLNSRLSRFASFFFFSVDKTLAIGDLTQSPVHLLSTDVVHSAMQQDLIAYRKFYPFKSLFFFWQPTSKYYLGLGVILLA